MTLMMQFKGTLAKILTPMQTRESNLNAMAQCREAILNDFKNQIKIFENHFSNSLEKDGSYDSTDFTLSYQKSETGIALTLRHDKTPDGEYVPNQTKYHIDYVPESDKFSLEINNPAQTRKSPPKLFKEQKNLFDTFINDVLSKLPEQVIRKLEPQDGHTDPFP